MSELGAVAESESAVEQDVLRNKVLGNVRVPDTVGLYAPITIIGGFPELTSESKRALFAELQREVKESHGEQLDQALLKQKILRS